MAFIKRRIFFHQRQGKTSFAMVAKTIVNWTGWMARYKLEQIVQNTYCPTCRNYWLIPQPELWLLSLMRLYPMPRKRIRFEITPGYSCVDWYVLERCRHDCSWILFRPSIQQSFPGRHTFSNCWIPWSCLGPNMTLAKFGVHIHLSIWFVICLRTAPTSRSDKWWSHFDIHCSSLLHWI